MSDDLVAFFVDLILISLRMQSLKKFHHQSTGILGSRRGGRLLEIRGVAKNAANMEGSAKALVMGRIGET